MEKLYGLPELLVVIYKNLTFDDQLSFAQVNSSFRSIFESFIFPIKYPTLKIRKQKKLDEFFVSNDKDEDCMLLSNDEVKNFFKFGCDQFKELHVISKYEEFNYSLTSFGTSWLNLQNLTCLHYENLLLSGKHLLMIAVNCPELKELRLIDCQCQIEWNREPCVIGRGISISTLEQMKQLKSLEIKNYFDTTIQMSVFCDFMTRVLPLECLRLQTTTLWTDKHVSLDKRTFHLKELEIELDSESLEILESIGIFKNLLKLHLNLADDVKDSDLQIIARACENLACLRFGSGTYSETTGHFVLPPKLKQLSFGWSLELKHKHIKDALTKFKIEELKCSCYEFDIRDFRISSSIKVVNLKSINILKFPLIYSNNSTLKDLHWWEHVDPDDQNDTQNRACLKTCKNLENLFIHSGFVPLDVLLELKQLQKLQIRHTFEALDWSYVTGLLKHSSLKELQIHDTGVDTLDDGTYFPLKGFPSTITSIYLALEVLEEGLKFWLDMLQQNPKLSIKSDLLLWLDIDYFSSFLKRLISHENFPKDLREIKLWGFNLDCKDLRENFLATIRPVMQIEEKMSWDLKTLVLCRKN